MPMLKRLLITGAGGGLGRLMRERLKPLAEVLRLSDIVDIGAAGDGEEVVTCDLADPAAVLALVEGCDGVLHLGGVSVEDKFSKILAANIQGVTNLYEAARAHGQPRIIFASSNHTVGFWRQDQHLGAQCTLKPDGFYGVSKCFGEAVASMYFHKFGQETAIVRIGSCFPEPVNHRMLSTWMSPDDFASLIACVFRTPMLGCPIVYGVSDNDSRWWDNEAASFLGWKPKDNSERFRAKLDATLPRPAKDAVDAIYQGGKFCADPIFPE